MHYRYIWNYWNHHGRLKIVFNNLTVLVLKMFTDIIIEYGVNDIIITAITVPKTCIVLVGWRYLYICCIIVYERISTLFDQLNLY